MPHHAWIRTASLKDNITFGEPMNQTLYDKIIEACALVADLNILPGGDETEIGEKVRSNRPKYLRIVKFTAIFFIH